MDLTQIIVTLFGGGLVGVVVKIIVDQWRISHDAKAKQRRTEIDRAASAEREVRILKESLAIHRRIIIDAPCLGPADLPAWPTTSITTKETP